MLDLDALDDAGRLKTRRVYHDADAASGGYYETIYRYGFTASSPYRAAQVVIGPKASPSDATRTWRKTVSDAQGRAWRSYVGAGSYTDETTSEPANMALLAQQHYDDEEDDGENVGDGRLTRTRQWLGHSPERSIDTDLAYDTEGRLVVTYLPEGRAVKTTYDFQGRATVQERWERSGVTLTTLLAKSETLYDDIGRAYQQKVYKVESGSASDTLKSDTYRDKLSRVRKTVPPGGAVSRSDFDGAGRVTASWTETSGGVVLAQTDTVYDDVGNAVAVRTKALKADATGTGDANYHFTYAAAWYDEGHRPEVSAFNGSKNTSSWWPTPPAKPSASSADWLVTKTEYDAAGSVWKAYDAKGIVTKNEYSDAGQLVRVTEDDGGIARQTELTYNGDGQVLTRTAKAPAASEDDQTTTYYYNTASDTYGTESDELATTQVLARVRYSDHLDTDPGEVKMKYDLAGRLVERTDQRGTVITTEYDDAGRRTWVYVDDANTSGKLFGARAFAFTYDQLDRMLTAVTYSDDADTSDSNQVTKVVREYDGWGNPAKEKQWQEWDGQASDFKYKKEAPYTYSYSSANNYLLLGERGFPTGDRSAVYAYGDDGAGQYESAWVSHEVKRLDTFGYAGAVTKYSLDGDGRKVSRPYFKNAGEDWIGGTVYTYDDFGRLTGIGAENAAQETIVDFTRAYDYNGNPLYTEYGHKTARSELYGTQAGQDPEGPADALNRLTRYRRGTLNGNKDDVTAVLFEQDWQDTAGALTLDKLGNWDAMRLDPDGDDTAQSMTATARGHNLANEYVSKDGQSAYAHDRNGNMTDDTKHTYYYDFANHLIAAVLKDTGDTVGDYRYDALGRRVRKVVDNTDTWDGTTLFYYDGMRVIEEGKLDGNGAYQATHQYVWGFYIDELLVFDYDAEGDFDLEDTSDQRGHSFQDFIYSTAAVMDPDGNVLERYDYEPYGAVTRWNGSYTGHLALDTGHCLFLFTGQRYDPETGLYHYKGRTYHPTLGRFIHRDPREYVDGMNQYAYVRCAPSLLSDPEGLDAQWDRDILISGTLTCVRPLTSDVFFCIALCKGGWKDAIKTRFYRFANPPECNMFFIIPCNRVVFVPLPPAPPPAIVV